MLLNPTKTDIMLCGMHAQRQKVDVSSGIDVAGAHVSFSGTIKLCGVVSSLIVRCRWTVMSLQLLHPRTATHSTADGPRHCQDARPGNRCHLAQLLQQLDVWYVEPDKRLQVTQNALARAVCSAPWFTSATELRRSLHWLPVRQRVDYKLALITFKA